VSWCESTTQTQGDVDEQYQDWHLNERPDHGSGGYSGFDPEDGNRNGGLLARLAYSRGRDFLKHPCGALAFMCLLCLPLT
jgi:hypothetical protein